MKALTFFILMMIFAIQSRSGDLQAYYYYAPYYNASIGTYIETYMTVVGSSLEFKKNENGKFQAILEITMIFSQEGNVKEYKKYNLKSPEITDTLNKPNFIDLQRITLIPGIYNYELKIKDIHAESPKDYIYHDIISISHNQNEIEISGIEYLEKYSPTQVENQLSRNGYDMIPYVADYYPSNVKTFGFFLEIYNTKRVLGENQDFLLKYFIENVSSKEPNPNYIKTKKQKSADVIPLLGEFSIDGLETGNYNFVVELRDKENKILATKKVFFQRSNPKVEVNWEKLDEVVVTHTFVEDYKSLDTLKMYIKEMHPISDAGEQNYASNALKSGSLEYIQKYFYSFWKSRNNSQPEQEWKKYKEQVDYVNRMYGSQIKKGYESDRGRVYLQYGAPNNVIESKHEPTAYPYEIWHYYALGNQRNKRFVFYSPELVGKDYILLHSDVFGEIYDKNWERKLSSRNNTLYNPDATESDGQWGGNAGENFKR